MEWRVSRTDDFEVTGDGAAAAWDTTEWQTLTRVLSGSSGYSTRVKALYSADGIYFLFDCEDQRLTCTLTEDHGDLFTEDVAEVFLWPDDSTPLYFEYEVSPLGLELPLLVANRDGEFHGWLPWRYWDERKVRHATATRGGPKASRASVSGWSAEMFIPFALLRGLGNTPPRAGARWRANAYRIDYDEAPASLWSWSPHIVGNFHDYRHFGTLVFE